MIVDKDHRPPPHPVYGDTYERGTDPWHRDGFPEHLKDRAPHQGEKLGGWYLNDAFQNLIGFVEDGTEFKDGKL